MAVIQVIKVNAYRVHCLPFVPPCLSVLAPLPLILRSAEEVLYAPCLLPVRLSTLRRCVRGSQTGG